MRIAVLFSFVLCGCASVNNDVPAGAMYHGYKKLFFIDRPSVEKISNGVDCKEWFQNIWYKKNREDDLFVNKNQLLVIKSKGELVSISKNFNCGVIPLLPGRSGFYVEFKYKISSNNKNNWPAVWLMPAEHNNKKLDVYGDDENYQEWMELDVDEGGFGPGVAGTVHSWRGIYPKFKNLQNKNNLHPRIIDRTVFHRFGVSYDPVSLKVHWWLDDELLMSAGEPFVPMISRLQNYYLIMSNQSHGLGGDDYDMTVEYVRAFVPEGYVVYGG